MNESDAVFNIAYTIITLNNLLWASYLNLDSYIDLEYLVLAVFPPLSWRLFAKLASNRQKLDFSFEEEKIPAIRIFYHAKCFNYFATCVCVCVARIMIVLVVKMQN